MSNPVGPGSPDDTTEDIVIDPAAEPATEIIGSRTEITEAAEQIPDRLFTAPSSYDDATRRIERPADPETEVFAPPNANDAVPQHVSSQEAELEHPARQRSWGWVVAVILVIAALAAVAVLATVLLTRHSSSLTSTPDGQDDDVRAAIQTFDTAIQSGDLSTLRTITCGATKDNYVNQNEQAWDETQAKVSAAKTYQVVSSVERVTVTGDHAEATVTTHPASAPQALTTRNFGLQRESGAWKICPAPTG